MLSRAWYVLYALSRYLDQTAYITRPVNGGSPKPETSQGDCGVVVWLSPGVHVLEAEFKQQWESFQDMGPTGTHWDALGHRWYAPGQNYSSSPGILTNAIKAYTDDESLLHRRDGTH